MRKKFYTPRGKANVDQQWRNEMLQRATGALTLSGGTMTGRQLAAILGVSPRGLRPILEPLLRSRALVVEMREMPTGGKRIWDTWYRIDAARLPRPVLPALLTAPAGPAACGRLKVS